LHREAERSIFVQPWVKRRKINSNYWNADPSVIERVLKGLLHAIGLALNTIEENTGYCLETFGSIIILDRYAAMLYRIHRACVCRRENLVAFTSGGLKARPATQRCGSTGYGINQVLELQHW
jgi:hypothetical protein